jgi:glyoxylase-like metal-dependent hydrolase (beta-lactamase superfamily II)
MNFEYIKVKKVDLGGVTVHCVQAPESGEMVNAQLIETPNQLLLVDTLQLVPHADELKQYISSLKKPLDRIIITHLHPDHWMGAASFSGVPLYAFSEVIEAINNQADFMLNFHRSLHPDNPEVVPSEKVLPTEPIEDGTLTFDGVRLNLMKIRDTESPILMAVELPDHKVLLAQDLVYNKAFAYFGERTQAGDFSFDSWIKVLRSFEEKGYQHIFPGHGDPTDASILQEMTNYLNFVKNKIAEGQQGDDLVESLKTQYPDYRLDLTIYMSLYGLFNYTPKQWS